MYIETPNLHDRAHNDSKYCCILQPVNLSICKEAVSKKKKISILHGLMVNKFLYIQCHIDVIDCIVRHRC